MQYSDQPIRRPNEDLLDRAGFALSLAQSIDNLATARDGFVIAILGEWGSGKTSVVRLICRYLMHIEMERVSKFAVCGDKAKPRTVEQLEQMAEQYDVVEPYILEMQARNQQLALATCAYRRSEFRKLLSNDEAADNADLYWHLKAEVTRRPHTYVVYFSPWLIAVRAELASALLSDLARALGDPLGVQVKQAFAALIKRLSEFAFVAGIGAGLYSPAIGKSLGTMRDWANNFANRMSSGPTLDSLRNDLRAVLGKLKNQQILIVVDDLDRLTPNEAIKMVSLVKSLGDLPNVIYLLSYDEQALCELLKLATEVNGHEFLEKIVQYPVRLPRIEQEHILRILDAGLVEILGQLTDSMAVRISGAWVDILRHYVATPRDARRFLNVFAVAYAGVSDHTDPIDLLVLEALRLFEPEVYEFVRERAQDLV